MRRRPDVMLNLAGTLRLAAAVDPQAAANSDGTFSCVAAIFDVRIPRLFYDLVLRPGCFDRSLSERGLPTLLHDHDWLAAPIGTVQRCEETDAPADSAASRQLEADATLFPPDTDLLRTLRRAMTERNGDGRAPLREFSVGFDVRDARWDVMDDDEVLAVYDAQLWEFSVCLAGGALDATGYLRADTPDELLSRFPKPGSPTAANPAALAAVRREKALARTRPA